MVKPRLFKSSHINKFFSIFLLFTIATTNVLYPAVVIAQDLESPVEENSVVLDTSEDILDEGIQTNIFEEEEQAAPEFTFEDGIYTVNKVEAKEYIYPDNENVRVKFTNVTEEGNLVIKKVALTNEEKTELNTTDDYGWDISSTMSNGSFTYDLTLPNTQGNDVQVMYSENGNDFTNLENEIVSNNLVTIKGLDHFTTYVVTTPPVLTGTACVTAGATVGLGCFDTIQAAVTAAASGDTILVKAGIHTVTSQLIINKDLTIVGEDETTTIIVPGFNTASTGDARGLFLVNNNANVNISNITIDGTGFDVYQTFRVNSANTFNLSDATIKNIDYPGYTAFGIALMNTNGTIQNVSMSNIKRVGAIVFGTSNYTFDNYTYEGKGDGDWLDYGIELGGGGNADIQNSYIYNCRGIASSDGSTSGAILATTYYGTGTGANIEYSNFENNSTAILVGYGSSDTSVVTAHHNSLGTNDFAVSTTGPQVDATNNGWGTSKESEIQNLIDGDVLYNPWYGQNVSSSLTVNEYFDNGIYYVKDLLNFNLSAQPVYGQHLITGLWGYNEATGSRDNSRYIGWQTTNPDRDDIVNEDNTWNMVTDHWMGSNAPGTEITEGDYLLWTERYYDEGGYVSGSTIKERVTVDKTRPTGSIDTPADGTRTNGTITVSGHVEDALSGIAKVEVRLRNFPGNTFRTDWVEATIDSNGDYTVDIDTTTLPEDDYEVAVVAYDNVGNNKWLWRRPVVAVDRTAPSAPTGLQIIDHEGTVLGCRGITNNRNIKIDWSNNPETDLAYYILDLKDKDNHKQLTVSEYNARIRNLDGLYTYKIRATDLAGNTSPASEWCAVILDRVAPTGEIKGIKYDKADIENFITNDNTPKLYGSYADNIEVANVNIELYGQSYMPQYTGGIWISPNFGPIPDGTHTATLTITDAAGNETVVTQDIIIDTMAPIASYKHYDNGTEITDSLAYVKGINQLTFTGKYFDNDPSSGLLQDSYVIFEAQDDGSFKFSHNGKKSFCSWRKAPNLLSISGTSFVQTTPVEFTNCIATLPDGEYYMAHQVYDTATRKDIPSITQFRDVLGLHFIVDTVAPDTTITSPTDDTYVKGIVDLKGTVIEDNLLRYYYKVSGPENVTSKTVYKDTGFTDMTFYTWDTTNYQDGEYEIKLSARDKAQNKDTGSTNIIHLNIDNTKPEILAVEDQNLFEGDDLPTDVLTTATDNNEVVKLYYEANNVDFGSTGLQEVTPTTATNNWEINVSDLVIDGINSYLGTTLTKVDTSVLPEGDYNFTYYVMDIAGNQSPEQTFTVTINNIAPEATLGANTTDALTDENVTFTASFTDPSDIGQTTPDDSNWTYTLNYGNGVSVSGTVSNTGQIGTFTHSYPGAGTYTAFLKVCEDSLLDGEGICNTSEIIITATAPEVLGAQDTAVRATGSVVTLGTGGGFGVEEQNEEEEEETPTDENAEVKGTQSCENPKKISGYVYIDKNNNDKKDTDEKIFSDVRVTIYSEDEDGNKTYTKTLTTNSEGYWETYVCNGEYKISVNSEDLPKNYDLETEDVLGVSITDTTDEANININVVDNRNFLQKNWIWILLAVSGLTLTGYLVIASRKDQY